VRDRTFITRRPNRWTTRYVGSQRRINGAARGTLSLRLHLTPAQVRSNGSLAAPRMPQALAID
jgi:hypothetical protein